MKAIKKTTRDIIYIILSMIGIAYLFYLSSPKIIPVDSKLRILMVILGIVIAIVLLVNLMKFQDDWEEEGIIIKNKIMKKDSRVKETVNNLFLYLFASFLLIFMVISKHYVTKRNEEIKDRKGRVELRIDSVNNYVTRRLFVYPSGLKKIEEEHSSEKKNITHSSYDINNDNKIEVMTSVYSDGKNYEALVYIRKIDFKKRELLFIEAENKLKSLSEIKRVEYINTDMN